ncbi:MAG TPA: hypothetical protein VJB57_03165 [Dehalococcoidia bacterium]|nr:hypothetical protein [Dehalococcoidia bacterium]
MKRRVVLGGLTLLLVAVVLVALARGGGDSSDSDAPGGNEAQGGPIQPCTGLPPAQAIEPVIKPGQDVPADKARFSGAWEGMAGSEYAGLVVTNLSATDATSFYVFGNLRGRLVSQFRADGSLHQGGNQQITYTWSFGATPNVLESVRQEGNDRVAYTMRKCTLQP